MSPDFSCSHRCWVLGVNVAAAPPTETCLDFFRSQVLELLSHHRLGYDIITECNVDRGGDGSCMGGSE